MLFRKPYFIKIEKSILSTHEDIKLPLKTQIPRLFNFQAKKRPSASHSRKHLSVLAKIQTLVEPKSPHPCRIRTNETELQELICSTLRFFRVNFAISVVEILQGCGDFRLDTKKFVFRLESLMCVLLQTRVFFS